MYVYIQNDIISTKKKFINSILKNTEMDLSKTSNFIIDRLFELIVDKKKIKTIYLEPFIIKEYINNIEFLKNKYNLLNESKIDKKIIDISINKFLCEQMKKIRNELENEKNEKNEIIGVLSWKMFDCNIILGERDESFIDILEPKLNNIMKIINEINSTSSLEEKEMIINKYYGIS